MPDFGAMLAVPDASLLVARPRKNSESFREVEAVDASTSSSLSPSTSTMIDSIEEEPRECAATKTTATTTPRRRSSLLISSTLPSTPIIDWRQLPVAQTEPWIATTTCCSTSSSSTSSTLPTAFASTTTQVTVTRIPNVMELERPGLVCVKVFKASKETKLGLRVVPHSDGGLTLGHLNGPMAEASSIRTGDELIRINGQTVVGWTATRALAYLRDAWGWISLVVRPKQGNPFIRHASILKATPEDRLGISLSSSKEDRSLFVQKLNAAGLLGDGGTIESGHIVERINEIPCISIDKSTAISIIQNAPQWVDLRVRIPQVIQEVDHEIDVSSQLLKAQQQQHHQEQEEDNDATVANALEASHEAEENYVEAHLVSVAFWKVTKHVKLGMTLGKAHGVIYIQSLAGVAAGSILREGMSVVAINDRLACRMTQKEATSYLRNQEGSVRILARNPHGSAEVVQAMVYRPSTNASTTGVGVSFKGSEGRQLNICQVRGEGLFGDSSLNIGDSVLSINGISCSHSRPKDAVEMVRKGRTSVVILCKANTKACVAVATLGHTSRIYD